MLAPNLFNIESKSNGMRKKEREGGGGVGRSS